MQCSNSHCSNNSDGPLKKGATTHDCVQSTMSVNCHEDEVITRIRNLEEELSRKDAIIAKLKLDSDVCLDVTSSLNFPDHLGFEGPPGYKGKMESTITQQNMLIESLQEALCAKEEMVQTLTTELYTNKEQAASEIDSLKNALEEHKILLNKKERLIDKWALTNEKVLNLKKSLEEEYQKKVAALTEDVRKKYDDEISMINSKCNETLQGIIHSHTLKESFLKKQIELLSNRVTELYEMDAHHGTELEASRKIYEEELSSLKVALEEFTKKSKNCQESLPFQGNVVALNNQLAEALTREITLKAELGTYKKDLDRLRNQLSVVNDQLRESSKNEKLLSNKCRSLEKYLTEYKEETGLVEDLLNSFRNDIEMLNNALTELHDKIYSLIKGNRAGSVSSHESIKESVLSQSIEKDVYHLMKIIRQSYEDVLNLGDLIGNLNDTNQEMTQENDTLKTKMSELTKVCEEKEETFKSQFESMNSEIEALKQEVNALSGQLLFVEETSTSEKNKLTSEKEDLSKQIANFERDNKQLSVEIKQLDHYNGKLRTRVDELIEENEQLVSMNSEYEARNSDLFSQLGSMAREISSIRQMAGSSTSSELVSENERGEKCCVHKPSSTSTSEGFSSSQSGRDDQGSLHEVDDNKNCEAIVKWMERCSSLEQDNLRLVQEIQVLKIRVKDLEFGAELVQQELKAIEMKKQLLESKVEDYISLKKQISQLLEANKSYIVKLQQFEELKQQLLEENETLTQDRILSDKKFAIYINNQCIKNADVLNNDMLGELNEKIQEVVNLKEQIFFLQNERNNLLAKLDLMTEAKNIAVTNLEELGFQLESCKEELDVTLKEKMELSSSKILLEKQVSILNMRADYLEQILQSRFGGSKYNLVEEMQQELIKLYKKVIEEKSSLDKIATEKELRIEEKEELDARYRMEILMKNNLQLQNEKENLLEQLVKLQRAIHNYEEDRCNDPNWTKNLTKMENAMIQEVQSHKEQYARIEEALRSTGGLHNELQKLNDTVRTKTREISSLMRKLENLQGLLQSSEMRLRSVEKELDEKSSLLKMVEEQKNSAENKLLTIQKMLLEDEAKHLIQMKTFDWKLQDANLKLSQAELDNSLIRFQCTGNPPTGREKSLDDCKNGVESEYEKAIRKVRFFYKAQLSADRVAKEEHHAEQIIKLHEKIKEQASELEYLLTGKIAETLGYASNLFDRFDCQDIFTLKESFKGELSKIESTLNGPSLELFSKLKEKFQKYTENQILLSISRLKKENERELDTVLSTLKEVHDEEIELLKLKHEAEKHNEIYEIHQECLKSGKDKVNSLTQSLKKEESKKGDLLKKLQTILVNHFFTTVQLNILSWNKTYKKQMESLSLEFHERLKDYNKEVLEEGSSEDKAEEIVKDIEEILGNRKNIMSAMQYLAASVNKEYNDILLFLEQTVCMCQSKAVEFVDYLKLQLTENNNIITLQEEVDRLKLEKEDLQQQHKSAVSLLLSDHQAELLKTRALLTELKEHGDSSSYSTALLQQRSELEAKHAQDMENLRIYFEKKCGEIKKQYSEEIESQRSRKTSYSSSSSGSDLGMDILYNQECESDKIKGHDICETFDNKDDQNSKLRDLEDKYKAEIEMLKSQLKNMNSPIEEGEVLTNLKAEYEKELELLNEKWKERVESLRAELEEKYTTRIEKMQDSLKELKKCQELEEKVKYLQEDVREEYQSEIERMRREIHFEEEKKHEEKLKEVVSKLKSQYGDKLQETIKRFNAELNKERIMKAKETEKLWLTRIEMEEQHKEELRMVEAKWETRLVEEMAKYISSCTLNKVHGDMTFEFLCKMKLEEETTKKLKEFEEEITNKIQTLQSNLENKEQHIRALQDKIIGPLEEEKIFTQLDNSVGLRAKVKERYNLKSADEIALLQVEQNKFQKEPFVKEDSLEHNYKNKMAALANEHKEAIESLKEKYEKEISLIHQKLDSPKRKNEMQAKAQQQVINELVEHIEGLIDGNREVGAGDGVSVFPPELSALEALFTAKYQKQLASTIQQHSLEIASLKQYYEEKLKVLHQAYNLVGQPQPNQLISTGNTTLDEIIKERDCLKRLTDSLKHAVTQLAEYLNNCEDELNKTVVEELLRVSQETPQRDRGLRNLDISRDESVPSTPITPVKRVHFAPNVSEIIKNLDHDLSCSFGSDHDISVHFREELKLCMDKLKTEASALLGLSALQGASQEVVSLKAENNVLRKATDELKKIIEKLEQEISHLKEQQSTGLFYKPKIGAEAIYDEADRDLEVQSYLQDKARAVLSSKENISPEVIKIIEDLCREGDRLIEESRRENDDLQQQILAADKQLRSTRRFLEEQAAERENERDEFNKEVNSLQAQLKERDRDWSSRERFTSEVEALEQQVKESTALLKESEAKKEQIEEELKAAVDKVWDLREIISELETQVSVKSEREAALEKKLDELEAELEQQNATQLSMAQELEVLRDNEGEETYLEQIQELQENIRMQFNSSVIRQIKSQLREMEKSIEHRTKELESLHVTSSNNSLSSPSEEISIREQLESMRSKTPEFCPSPVALPVEEVNKLQEKLQRHARTEEVVVRRVRDQHMRITKLSRCLEEVQAEREVLQKQVEKQMSQLAEANNKIDDLRQKAETAKLVTNRGLMEKVKELQEKLSTLERTHSSTCNKLDETEKQLLRAEGMLDEQRIELKMLAQGDHEMVDSLRLELASVTTEKNKLESLVDKYKREQLANSKSVPALMEVILDDKNEDIDHLQETVAMLRSQPDEERQNSSRNSKGHRVSFATQVSVSQLSEDFRVREAPREGSFIPSMSPNFEKFISLDEDQFEAMPEPPEPELPKSTDSSLNISVDSLSKELNDTRNELSRSLEKIQTLESELHSLKYLEEDMDKTKRELETTIASVMEDKNYYKEQLTMMAEAEKRKDEEIMTLHDLISKKDEELVKTTADIRALQSILNNMQAKLKEAKRYALQEIESSSQRKLHELTEEIKNLKSENQKLCSLEGELVRVNDILQEEKEISTKLREALSRQEIETEILNTEISSLKQENEYTLKRLRDTEMQVEHYITQSEILKKELALSKKEFESESRKVSNDFENATTKNDSQILKLNREISTLKRENSRLDTERKKLEDDVSKLKIRQSDLELGSNQNDLIKLEKEVHKLKEFIKSMTEDYERQISSYRTEIKKLLFELDNLKTSENVVRGALEEVIGEKCELQMKVGSVRRELFRGRKEEENRLLEAINNNRQDYLVEDDLSDEDEADNAQKNLSEIDDLTVQVRKELDLSAQLDKSIIGTLQSPAVKQDSSNPAFRVHDLNEDVCSSSSCDGLKLALKEKISSLETSLAKECSVTRDLRQKLSRQEAEISLVRAKKAELESQMDKLTRVANYQEGRITQLSVELDEQKNKVLTLELNIVKEKTNFKQLQTILEGERQKRKVEQKDDTQLIETLRVRLENALEVEGRLKIILGEAKDKIELLEAKLNSARALEQYNTDSENEHNKEMRKLLLSEKEKCVSLTLEVEKFKRTNGDLQDVISRERKSLCTLKDKLQQVEQQKRVMEREMDELRQQLTLEKHKRELSEDKIKAMEDADFRRSKSKIMHEKKQREMFETAQVTIRELQGECKELREHLRVQQENDERWRDDIHIPLVHQLNDVNANLEGLVKERSDLRMKLEQMKNENERLQSKVVHLQQNVPERLQGVAGSWLPRPDWGLDTDQFGGAFDSPWNINADYFTGPINDSFKHLLGRYIRAESYRKALAWQKRYLLVTLHGFSESHANVLSVLLPPEIGKAPRRLRFKHVALAVIAVRRMRGLVSQRRGQYRNSHDLLMKVIRRTHPNLINHGFSYGAQLPEVPRFPAHSPPSRDSHTNDLRRPGVSTLGTESPLSPNTMAEYLAIFNGLQKRLGRTLEQTQCYP